ncbi:MAG: DUF2284 domain-containing protein [Anaerolineales bacterium]
MAEQDDLRRYAERLLGLGAAETRVIDPRAVITAEWVRWKCQYGCSCYGQRLTCPPHSPTPERTRAVLDSYSMGILARFAGEVRPSRPMVAVEQEAFLDGYYKAFGLGEGPCRWCEECTLENCLHPTQARPSMEACGIDVFGTVQYYGLPIHTLREEGEPRNLYGLLLLR